MALVPNPVTGELEDDGLPEANPVTGAPVVAAPAPALPIDQPAADSGGGPVLGTETNPATVTIAARPKPPVEIVTGGQTSAPSKEEIEAKGKLGVANTLVEHATKNETGVAQEEAKINQGLADSKVQALEDQKVREFELEQQEKREEEAIKTHARTLAEDRAKKQIAAGRARADFFKGNFIGEIVAALVQSVAAGLHARAGKTGLSPAERIFEERYQNHEKALLAEYESSKQAEDDYRKDRPRWEAERAARRAKAAQDALHDVNMAIAVADRSLAKLGPEKAANAQDMKIALQKQADAKFELEFTKGLRDIRKWEKTLRPMGDGTTAAGEAAWSNKPMGREERQAAGYGATIIESMARSGHIPLSRETIKKFQANMRQLQKESPDIITNFLREKDLHVLPDDFFTGITDPLQRQAMRDWSNAANAQIRQESGAAIPTFEQLNNAYRNIPTTDSPPEEQKRLRDDMINVGQRAIPRKLEAKPLYDKAEEAKQKFAEGKPAAAKTERKVGDRARDPRDGSIHQWDGKKWVKVK